MRDILSRVKGVTERTLRRDLLKLQEQGLITKKGSTKSAQYLLKDNA
jgi:DeoR/GlpR family transcriptional regulator of sugar metabolism